MDDMIGTYNCTNALNVRYSSNCEDIENSQFAHNSSGVYNSSDISDCLEVENSTKIFKSQFVTNSKKVLDSSNVENSENIVLSNFVYNSHNIYDSEDILRCSELRECHSLTDSYFCAESKNLKNCLFCHKLCDKEYHIFNKPVDKDRYENIKNRYLRLVDFDLPYLKVEWPHQILRSLEPVKNLHYSKHYQNLSDKFCKWIVTLQNYDDEIFYYLTLNFCTKKM